MTPNPEPLARLQNRWTYGGSTTDAVPSLVQITDRAFVPGDVTMTLKGLKGEPDLTLHVHVDSATSWRCTSLTVNVGPDGEITTELLKGLPLWDLATGVIAQAIWTPVSGGKRGEIKMGPNPDDPDARAKLFSVARKRRVRSRVTPAKLERAAEIYRQAVEAGDPAPTNAVAAELDVPRSTAGRYVQQARGRGFLPGTTKGKAQA